MKLRFGFDRSEPKLTEDEKNRVYDALFDMVQMSLGENEIQWLSGRVAEIEVDHRFSFEPESVAFGYELLKGIRRSARVYFKSE